MFLTNEILAEYDPCIEGKDWFARIFPNGAELIDVIHTRHVPPSFLHWGRLYLPTNEEERRAYDEVLHITNSTNVFQCDNIDNCDMITDTTHAVNSRYIYRCEDIEDSEDVAVSKKVRQSKHISNSLSIYSSEKCVQTNNAKDSFNISTSTFVINSHDIFQSNLITNGSFIFNSKNVSDSAFIGYGRNLEHCLFCYDNENQKYALFNQPVSEVQWNFIYEELQDLTKDLHLCLFEEWDPEDCAHTEEIHRSHKKMFEAFGDKMDRFVNWVVHLPYYNADIAYKITFIPYFLQESSKN